jgi:5,10-methenyltetrahydrofolate synthetase
MKDWNEIKAWRKARRAELVAQRAALPRSLRAEWNARITARLEAAFALPGDAVLGFCWPFKGEFDPRFAVRRWRAAGVTAALPEVVAPGLPLRFRRWWPGAPMRPGVYGIPVPDGTGIVVPDVAIVPMNGFDARGFRLGYGGGYFDRTLAALEGRLLAIGVSYEPLRLQTIHPQPHDIPMDFVVTEQAVYAGGGAPLTVLEPAACRDRAARLMAERGLPRARAAAPACSSPPCYAAQFADYFGGGRGGGRG